MALKFQYNKTALRDLDKQLNIRTRALPTLKNKESALRVEVKKAKKTADSLEGEIIKKQKEFKDYSGLWCEFNPDLVKITDLQSSTIKIAGVKIEVFDNIIFAGKAYNIFTLPVWFNDGIEHVKEMVK